MFYVCLAVFVLLFVFSVCFRVAVSHPFKTLYYSIADFAGFLRYRKWRVCGTGTITCYVGLFGRGKTLSAVHHAVSVYCRYNNRKVYDPSRGRWVTQKIHVLSNVDLCIPFERFTGLQQIVSIAENVRRIDEVNGTLTVTLVLGDEFSVQLNSRSFKTNIDPLFLNALLTCRHHRISLVYTSQRFHHVDALLRQVTSHVITCGKVWRFMVHGQYDADDLEHAVNPRLVKPLRRFGWFISDRDYCAYDTLACVGNLVKSCTSGDMLSEEEILALQQNGPAGMDAVGRPSRSFVRRSRKLKGR